MPQKAFNQGVWQLAWLEAPVVVSANCLLAGHVLYLNKDEEWVRTLASAHPFESAEEAHAVAAEVTDSVRVIGIELVGVALEGGQTVPRHYREAIRAKGPGAYVSPSSTGEGDVSIHGI